MPHDTDFDQWEKERREFEEHPDEYDAEPFWTICAIILMFSIWVGILWMMFV